ncbi:MAG: sensor histidine kinase [Hyphomicrobiales bacterium]
MIRSLRVRLLLAATAAVTLALAVAGTGLVILFERHVERRIGEELDTYLRQMAAGIVIAPDGTLSLPGGLADPRFEQPYSGLYWQAEEDGTSNVLRSRSLWDTRLDLPADTPPLGSVDVHDIPGPSGTTLHTHERRLAFPAASGEKVLRLAAAIDRADIAKLTSDFAGDVAIALVLLGAVLVLAAWMQVNIGLKPLAAVRRGVAAVRAGEASRLGTDVPAEIAPLAEEVNALLEAQEKTIRRARDRAADLAHGFKTPLTALIGDARRVREGGDAKTAGQIEATVRQMHGHIDRELARSRVRNLRGAPPARVALIVAGLAATLARTPRGEEIAIAAEVGEDVKVRAAPDDLNDILGNLLDNAVRHAGARVRLRARAEGERIAFEVEDDGPGIPDRLREAMTARGRRMDSSPAGAGLGLAIVSEVLEQYGETLSLGRSRLGGLKASFRLPG